VGEGHLGQGASLKGCVIRLFAFVVAICKGYEVKPCSVYYNLFSMLRHALYSLVLISLHAPVVIKSSRSLIIV